MKPYRRGQLDCVLDDVENAHFSSIGGLNKRDNPTVPKYVLPADRTDYLRGYTEEAEHLYGEEWQTVEFTWKPAPQINPK